MASGSERIPSGTSGIREGYFGRIRHHLAYNYMLGRLRPQGFKINEDEGEPGMEPEEPEPEEARDAAARVTRVLQAVTQVAGMDRATTQAAPAPPPPKSNGAPAKT